MNSSDDAAASERSRWLAELAEAIRQAQRLAADVSFPEHISSQAGELVARLESVRIEVDALRRCYWAPRATGIDPMRTNPFPWERRHQHWRAEN